MKYKECPECKSTQLIITQDLNGKVYDITCLSCGFNETSPEWESMTKKIDDMMKDFEHADLVKTKRKKI